MFPIFEHMLRFFENKDPGVRRHFNQALVSMNEKKTSHSFIEFEYGIEFKS